MAAASARLATACLILAGVACAPTRRMPESRNGRFRYLERVADTSPSVQLDGEFTVTQDTIILDASSGSCRYDESSSRTTNLVYRCTDAVFMFDRRDPINHASYVVTTTVRVPVRTCAITSVDSSGRQVCTRYKTEYEERRVQRTGRLRPKRLA
jgi:hypothetical protein